MSNIKKKEVVIGYEHAGNSTFRVISDAKTGEIIDQGWINKTEKKPGRKKNEGAYFIKLYRTNLIQIATEKAKDKRLDFDEAGLFFMLLAISGWQTTYIKNPNTDELMGCSDIAKLLKRDRKHIHNLLERLIAKGMIAKTVNGNGRANYYMINTNIAFYGKTIDDLGHLDVFKSCPYTPVNYINYRKTPEKKK